MEIRLTSIVAMKRFMTTTLKNIYTTEDKATVISEHNKQKNVDDS